MAWEQLNRDDLETSMHALEDNPDDPYLLEGAIEATAEVFWHLLIEGDRPKYASSKLSELLGRLPTPLRRDVATIKVAAKTLEDAISYSLYDQDDEPDLVSKSKQLTLALNDFLELVKRRDDRG